MLDIFCDGVYKQDYFVFNFQKAADKKQTKKNKKEDKKKVDKPAEGTIKLKRKEEEEEEIPQLVPIETSAKKPKLEVSTPILTSF